MNITPKTLKKTLSLLALVLFGMQATAQEYPFQNPELSSEERAEDLISRLTLVEKASLLQDQSPAIPRLGIPKFNWWSEALHGYANNDSVTVFPQNIGMAASFDLGTGEVDSTYAAGENLLGNEDGLRINYKPQGLGFLSIDLPEDRQPQLKAGHTYVIELKGVSGTASMFWRSSQEDIYRDGAAFLGRKQMKNDEQTGDFGIALYGN